MMERTPGTRKCPRCGIVDIPLDGRPMCHGCRKDLGIAWMPRAEVVKRGLA